MDYAATIKHIERLLDQRRARSAMQEMGSTLEQLLKELYQDYLPRLTPTDRAAVSHAERDTATKVSRPDGAQAFTLGQLERFLRGSAFFDKAASAGASVHLLRSVDLKPFVDARNDATHEAKPPSENAARLYFHQLVQFLEEAGKLATEPALSPAATLKPWTDVVTPHADIQRGQLEMSTYAADLWAVAFGGERCPMVYRTADAFFAATYMTSNLAALLADVVRVLNGSAGDRVLQLRTPFGGGKTHALIALYHLATCSGQQRSRVLTAVGEKRSTTLPDPGPVGAAVLHGLSLDPQSPRVVEPGVTLHTLWGELAYQLGGKGAYDLVRTQDEHRSAPGKPVLQRITGGDPALILIDEVLVYVEKARALAVGDSTYGRQVMIFLQTLTETVRGLNQVALVYSLQASHGEAYGAEGLLAELDHLVSRIDSKREPVSGDEVLKVVQRRLFSDIGPREVRAAVARAYAERYRSHIEADDPSGAAQIARRLEARILDSYPLHPDLLDLMYHRWGSLPSYQRTRGALAFLATAVSAIATNPSTVQPLFGPGDVLLEDDATRNALFAQVGEREHYSSVLAADITGEARTNDVDRRIGENSPVLRRLRVGTRVATAAFLYSFGARQGEDRGVARDDLIASCLSPDLDRNIITTTLHELQETLLYLHYVSGRYRFETKPNLNKLLNDEARQFDTSDVLQEVKQRLVGVIGKVAGSEARLWPEDSGAIPDRLPVFQIAYLGPEWSTLGQEELYQQARQWIEQRGSSKRVYKNGLALALPTGRLLDQVRNHTRTLLAVDALLGAKGRYGFSSDQVADLNERRTRFSGDIQASLKQLYTTLILPIEAQQDAQTGTDPLALEILDMRSQPLSSEYIQERVLEALRHWVFASVTPTRLLGLTRLGHDDAHQTLSCETLVGYCFSFLNFPKLLGREPLQKAIVQGVADSIFGYSAALQFDAAGQPFVANHQMVRIGVPLSTAEVDLSSTSYLLAPDLARHLAQPPQLSQPEPVSQSTPTDEAAVRESEGNDQASQMSSSTPVPPSAVSRPLNSGRRYRLQFTVNKQQLFRAFRPLQNLAEKADDLTVTLDVTAHANTPLDATWLRNAVEEPLDESDVTFEGGLEE
jgi:hypothetical protein